MSENSNVTSLSSGIRRAKKKNIDSSENRNSSSIQTSRIFRKGLNTFKLTFRPPFVSFVDYIQIWNNTKQSSTIKEPFSSHLFELWSLKWEEKLRFHRVEDWSISTQTNEMHFQLPSIVGHDYLIQLLNLIQLANNSMTIHYYHMHKTSMKFEQQIGKS